MGTNTLFVLASAGAAGSADGRRHVFDGALGTDQPLTVDNRFRFCPMLGAGYRWRTADRLQRDVSGLTARAAVHVSLLAINSRRGTVLPTAGLELLREPVSVQARATTVRASGGVGVLLPRRIGVQLEAGIRLGLRRREPYLSVGGTYGF